MERQATNGKTALPMDKDFVVEPMPRTTTTMPVREVESQVTHTSVIVPIAGDSKQLLSEMMTKRMNLHSPMRKKQAKWSNTRAWWGNCQARAWQEAEEEKVQFLSPETLILVQQEGGGSHVYDLWWPLWWWCCCCLSSSISSFRLWHKHYVRYHRSLQCMYCMCSRDWMWSCCNDDVMEIYFPRPTAVFGGFAHKFGVSTRHETLSRTTFPPCQNNRAASSDLLFLLLVGSKLSLSIALMIRFGFFSVPS